MIGMKKWLLCFGMLVLLFSMIGCDSNPENEYCAKVCEDKYGECEYNCKTQSGGNTQLLKSCLNSCEWQYNQCIWECY